MLRLFYLYLFSSFTIEYIFCFSQKQINANFPNKPKEFRYDYTYVDELDGWLKLHRVPEKWYEARNTCKLEGADIASPESVPMLEAMMINMNIRDVNTVFTGIHCNYSISNYFTVKGVPIERMPLNWAPNGLSSDNAKRMVVLFRNGTIMNDYFLSYPYFCYKQNKNEPLTKCGTIDTEYEYKSDVDTCYKYHVTPKNWFSAFKTCAAEGGHLAVINNSDEAEAVVKLFDKYKPGIINGIDYTQAFIGFIDMERKGEWLTINGDTLSEAGYERWSPGEPTSQEYCGALQRNVAFNNIPCHYVATFICEKKKDSLAAVHNITFRNGDV